VRDQRQHQFCRRADLSHAGATLLRRNSDQREQGRAVVLQRGGRRCGWLAQGQGLRFLGRVAIAMQLLAAAVAAGLRRRLCGDERLAAHGARLLGVTHTSPLIGALECCLV